MEPPFKMIVETEMERYRYNTWDTKEPETIEWIKSFSNWAIFFDVGANIGVYSLYRAAIHPDSVIFAFEPDKKNYARLIGNIALNEFKNIIPFCWIVAGKRGKKGFITESDEIGSSGGQMQERGDLLCRPIDGMTLGVPHHIKIDIDGQEIEVIRGMKKTLNNKRLRSVLVEIDNDRDEIMRAFLDNGFTTDNPFNKMKNHSRLRRAREGINVENMIFTRR